MPRSWIRYLVLAALLGAGPVRAETLTVSAAASLTNAFKEIAASYEAQHRNTKVLLNFGASGALLQQISRGAPVDVFASADQETMDSAEGQGLIAAGERRNFARNTLVLVVPLDGGLSPAHLEDLARPAVQRIAIGNPATVPAGRYARRALDAAGLWPAVSAKAINTRNVRQALDYVARGEVEAGFVYATDAAMLKDEVHVAFEVPLDIAIVYPMARVADSAHADEAKRFMAYVLSTDGQAILGRYGFRKP